MSNLRIDKLSIRTSTNDGMYGVDIPFTSGLNIIHAENTHGKSTCIQSIIFALGLEGCLGPSRKVPLKTALTSHLRKKDGSKALIFESKIYLQISNGVKTVTLMRSSIVDKKDLVTVFDDATFEETQNSNAISHDYYLRVEGSASRDRGFHYFLSNFLGIKQPNVMKYDGRETQLYLEAIFSVNYVEQTRGWGGILNVLPTYLSIKDLPEKIIEYTLALDVHDISSRKQIFNQNKKDAERLWGIGIDSLISTAKSTSGFVSNELDDVINKNTTLDFGSYLYCQHNAEPNTYSDYITHLNHELSLLKTLKPNEKVDEEKVTKLEEELRQYSSLLVEQENIIGMLVSDLNISEQYRSSIEQRILDVNDSLRKYKDLRRLQSIGSEEEFQLTKNKCPTCHMDVEDSLLSHVQNENTKILGLEDNIKYLEKQRESFDALLKGEKKSTRNKDIRLDMAKSKISETRSLIREIKNSLVDEKSSPSRSDIKKELILEHKIETYQNSLTHEQEIIGQLYDALKKWKLAEAGLKALPSSGLNTNDWRKLKALKESFVSYLDDFGYSSNDLSDFEISDRSYKPTLNDIDINSEASASDGIRVIWSYLYSLLTLEKKNIGETNHLGLLIMDEPRQQEAKNDSFEAFILRASEVKSMGKQIIIGTSEELSSLEKATSNIPVNLNHFSSDIIEKLNIS